MATLRERLASGGLSFADVLHIGADLGDALAAGSVALDPRGIEVDPGGVILHDAAAREARYRAPEEVEGRPRDARSDVWTLGLLLYEMAAGRPAFPGPTETLDVAIRCAEPMPLSTLRPELPVAFARVVRTCLVKDPERRWQDPRDVASALRWIADDAAGAPSLPPPRPPRPARWPLAIAAALGLGAGLLVSWQTAAPLPGPARMAVTVPAVQSTSRPLLAVSPDGRQLAFVSGAGASSVLYLRPLDRIDPIAVAGTEGASAPFFSPEGARLGFFASGQLKVVHLPGNGPLVLADAPDPHGGAWLKDGTIVFAPDARSALQQVPEGGGAVRPFTALETGTTSHRWPSTDGRSVVYTAMKGGRPRVALVTGPGAPPRDLVEGASAGVLAGPGRLLFVRYGSLQTVRITRGQLGGDPALVTGDLVTDPGAGSAQCAASAHGTLAVLARPVGPRPPSRLAFVDAAGHRVDAPLPLRAWERPRVSPDGRQVAVIVRAATSDLWIGDLRDGTLRPLTADGQDNETPAWLSNDRVLYGSRGGGTDPRRVQEAARVDEVPLVWLTTPRHVHVGNVGPAGNVVLAAFPEDRGRSGDLVLLAPRDRELRPLLATPASERAPRLSPDGRFVAYVTDASGQDEVAVIAADERPAAPDARGPWPVSAPGADAPMWSRDGRTLFFRSGSLLYAVDVAPGPAFHASIPRVWGDGQPLLGASGSRAEAMYDTLPDGRILFVDDLHAPPGPGRIVVTLGWEP